MPALTPHPLHVDGAYLPYLKGR